MNDEDLDYCEMCGEVEEECVCNLVLSTYQDNEPDFKWEYAHEIGTYEHTQFKIIMPYD